MTDTETSPRFSHPDGTAPAPTTRTFLALGARCTQVHADSRTVEAAGEAFEASFIWVGVPHAVLFPRDELPLERKVLIGRELRHNLSLFPEGANINFVMPDEDGRIRSVTYERGVEDLTDSCGTGSTASAICHVLKGSVSKDVPVVVDVINPGGINSVTLVFDGEGKSAAASLRGRTVIVAEGFLTEEL